ncbi:hypothetical protein [Gellertiella hungarica]|uniref:DdrB-like domain-containing protein n=1 Tax=Gellertiella hungarica TaxID=1572859 RepID=A0A7W6J8I3_9HYPH|nr:hypothetical protein [Gellertiella hungarica]MBB4066750.1 hypothetical protein [Gellertiella hungarica]
MPFLVNDDQMRGALQAAAQRPFEGVDPGFAARFKADLEAMQNFSNSNAEYRTRVAAENDFQNEFYKASGQMLPNWSDSVLPFKRQEAMKQFEAWKKNNPDSPLEFPTPEVIRRKADEKASEARQKSVDLSRRTTDFTSSVGGFLGTVVGGITDPINLLVSGLGGSAASGIVRTALVEGAAGVASESLIQTTSFQRKSRIDPEFSVGDALYEIGAAGVGGAALGAGFKGIAAAWHRAKTGYWPSPVRDAANVVSREAAVPASRFPATVRGDGAYRAAVEKAADDLVRSRPVELPKEAFIEAAARPGRVYDADGRSVGVRYEVVEATDLITSHTDDMTPNPAFPPDLQPRDRSRALSRDQVAGIAANLQPERLGPSPQAESGAPIVGPDGIVESGNGRVMALRRAYSDAGTSANNYRNFLRAQNFDIEGFTNPVLIARRVTDLENGERIGFVTAANRSTAMRMGATEQALSDARMIDGSLLDLLQGSDVKAAANQQFTRGFMAKLPRAEQGSLMDAGGYLSQEGERRITAALMGRAYGEPALLGRALEDTDNNIKAIAGALADAAGPWSRLRDAVARGEIPGGMDITPDLMNAVRLVMKARDEGRSMADLVNQAEMFGGPDELSKLVARALFSDADLKRPVGRARLAAFLNDFAEEAMKNDSGPRLFGEPLGAPDILKSSLDRVGRSDLAQIAEERLTADAVEEIAAKPQTVDAHIQAAQQLRAERPGITVDLGDGLGERSLDDILDEADDEIAAGKEIEVCATGTEVAAQ